MLAVIIFIVISLVILIGIIFFMRFGSGGWFEHPRSRGLGAGRSW